MPEKLITIAVFDDSLGASFSQQALISERIEVFLADENVANIYGSCSLAFGGVKLQVRESDVARAMEILELQQD